MAAFIPKQYKREPITIRIDLEKLHTIDTIAATFDISRSEFINQCIDYALQHNTSDEKPPSEPNGKGQALG